MYTISTLINLNVYHIKYIVVPPKTKRTFKYPNRPQAFSTCIQNCILEELLLAETLNLKENVQKWLTRTFKDPITKTLAENSNLTKTQLETLLIDILATNLAEKSLNTEEKAKLRLLKEGISRGSFNRTLRQARTNVIRSIYTLLLLGYLGVFDDTRLEPFLEVANKLQTYVSAYKAMTGGEGIMDEHLRLMKLLREELEASLEKLSKPSTLGNM